MNGLMGSLNGTWGPWSTQLGSVHARDHITKTMYMRWNKCCAKLLLLMEGCVNIMVVNIMKASFVYCSQW